MPTVPNGSDSASAADSTSKTEHNPERKTENDAPNKYDHKRRSKRESRSRLDAEALLHATEARLRRLWTRSSVRAEIAWHRTRRTIKHVPPPLRSQNVLIGLGALLAAVAVVVATTPVLPRETALMAGIFAAAALLWATEALPLFATGLLIIGLEIILLANPGGWSGIGFTEGVKPSYEVFLAPLADPIIVLFLGGFIMARAAVKENVDRALARLILGSFGTQPRHVMMGLMLITALFSMWMSNTAATAMMITLVMPMISDVDPSDPLRVGLVLAVPFAANIGGMSTPISSPPNAVAIGFLNSAGYSVSFLEWMLVAVPLATGLLLLSWGVLYWMHPPRQSRIDLPTSNMTLGLRGLFLLAVMGVTIALWCTDSLHGLPTAVVALLPVVAFTTTGVLTQADFDSLEWNILFLIAGGIALGVGMQQTGLDEVLIGVVLGRGPFVIGALALATVVISTLMSNTAAANLLVPVGVALATGSAGALSAVHVAVSIALAASVSMALPVSTPPNAIAYASGVCNTRDFVRSGLLIGAVAIVLIVALGGPIIAFWMPT